MKGEFLKLVENSLKNAQPITEEKAAPLSAEVQRHFFLGWLFAHVIEDPDYMQKAVPEIKADFSDDYAQLYDEETMGIEDEDFNNLIDKMINDIKGMEDEAGNDEEEDVPEPTEEPAPEPQPEAKPETDENVQAL
jgi:hypothetical protein